MKRHAWGYRRVSSDEQAQSGHSLDAQRDAIVDFCQRKGWTLGGIKTDAAISGTRDDRPALGELLQLVEQGTCDVVVVHAVDRFYRDLQGLLVALNKLSQHDASFISITENLDFTIPWGKLVLAVLGTLAEIYIDRLRAETRKGKKARAAKGLTNGAPPLGYCRGDCAVCVDPNGPGYCPQAGGPNRQVYSPAVPYLPHPIEAEAIKLAFQWYRTGRCSDGQIAERLNRHQHELPNGSAAHFRTKGRWGRGKPGRFSKDSVRELLQNPYYVGVVPYFSVNGKGQKRKRQDAVVLYPGRHEPLVDQETYDCCLSVRRVLGRHPRQRDDWAERIYTLSGILRCGYCGQVMRAQSGHGVRYYQDKSRIQRTSDCSQPYVHADQVEAEVGRFVQAVRLPPGWRDEIISFLHPDLDPETLKQEQESVGRRLERAKRLYLDGDLDDTEYAHEKALYETRLSDLRPENYSDILTAGEALETAEEWQRLEPLERK